MMYIDSHAHYDDSRYDNDRFALISRMENSNEISYIFNIGADLKGSSQSLDLALSYDFIYAVVGVHPHEVKSVNYDDLGVLQELYDSSIVDEKHKVVAIGEIGLDYYYDNSPRDIQQILFNRQLNIAKELNLPVVIHSRDAAEDTYNILSNSGVNKGIIHCFSYSLEMAKKFVDMGFYLGIGGVVTFKNVKNIIEVVENIDISRIVLETDCPYLSPEPKRGQRNDSFNLKYICEKIAEIKGMTAEEVAKITSENTLKVYELI